MAYSRRTWTKDDLLAAVKVSNTIREVLQRLGLKAAGGNYKQFAQYKLEYNIDTSHFANRYSWHWNKGKPPHTSKPITDFLLADINAPSNHLRKRLLKEGLLDYRCYNCLNTQWMGKPIPLELEHIDGNNRNNLLSNLIVLCPNCHSLTPTYRGKNKRKKKMPA